MKIERFVIEEKILEAYTALGFKPRGNQPEICFDVLDSFLNKGKQNVVLNAGTGVGKSIIAAVVSTVINECTTTDELSSIISMGQNSLAKQYAESFSDLGNYKFFQIKGASNYPCHFMESQPSATSKTAEECVKGNLLDIEQDKHCRSCEYDRAKKIVNVTANLITNYTYFFIAQLASGHLTPRKLHVMDEAHTLNDQFCSYSEIVVSVDLLDKYIKELGDTNGKCDNEIAGLIMLKNKVSSTEIGDNNYIQCIGILASIYSSVGATLGIQSSLLATEDKIKSAKYGKMSRKYVALAGKITDLIEEEYDHVFDNTVPNTFSIKTIFIGKMMEKLLTTYNLFMSATITEQFVYDTLMLDKTKTEFIMTDPVFPPENKPLFFIGKTSLNYNSLKDPDVIDNLKSTIKSIVEFHSEDKGIILVPSFYLGSQLARSSGRDTRVFEHKSGVNLSELISDFKRHRGSGILISPSIFEGLDFSNDESRFQIIVKSPYPSLGDKRIKYIADRYPHIYQEMTLLKILQGIGRSIRTPEDFAASYFLDASSKKLYNSRQNIWKNHYTVQTT